VLGSTAERLLRNTRVGVLVVAADPRDTYQKPLVAVDNEGTAEAVVRLLAHILTPDVHQALAIHVLEQCTPDAAPAVYSRGDVAIAQLHVASEKNACAVIQPALKALCGGDFAYELRCVEGASVHAIIDAARAENVDLVAVGTHGRAGLDRLVAGSVAVGVIRENDADTLVERTGERGWMHVAAMTDQGTTT
jgi:nucleotide-binding universal stress UspA family protein